jgi:hypothetical protein
MVQYIFVCFGSQKRQRERVDNFTVKSKKCLYPVFFCNLETAPPAGKHEWWRLSTNASVRVRPCSGLGDAGTRDGCNSLEVAGN